MEIQEIVAFVIVGLAIIFITRKFIPKPAKNKKTIRKCSCCESEEAQPAKRNCKC